MSCLVSSIVVVPVDMKDLFARTWQSSSPFATLVRIVQLSSRATWRLTMLKEIDLCLCLRVSRPMLFRWVNPWTRVRWIAICGKRRQQKTKFLISHYFSVGCIIHLDPSTAQQVQFLNSCHTDASTLHSSGNFDQSLSLHWSSGASCERLTPSYIYCSRFRHERSSSFVMVHYRKADSVS